VPDHGRFVFFDEWRLAAAPIAIWAVIRDATTWPDWWRSVHRATLLVPAGPNDIERWEFRFRTRLPYDISFVADLSSDAAERRVEARVSGRVDGHGGCRLEPIGGGTLVRFDWEVRPQATWMRAVSRFARPVFGWNHRSLMAEGAFGLARRLDTRLLTSPIGALLPA
jgi:hypothetical protein